MTETPIRVGMISLGCAKNLVDAEIMVGSLMKAGMEILNDPSSADVLIVNTCSFIDSAQEESIDTILENSELRNYGRQGQALIVSGCLPQRFREELPKLLPEVDVFMGVDQVARTPEIVRQAIDHRGKRTASDALLGKKTRAKGQKPAAEKISIPAKIAPIVDVTARPNYIPDFATPRFRLTPKHFAYVKIAEGCNHPCSFCIIPRMRGGHRSRVQSDVVAEARELISQGVREINLISQDSTYYGLDLRPERTGSIASPQKFTSAALSLPAGSSTLATLLRELNEIPGDFWVRLLYTHPAHWTDELIRTIAECRKVARYVDMPLQHIDGNMLERMRRETSREYIEELIVRIREGIPGIALRTTFIVGFPGEKEDYFETLIEFIRKTRFERLGVFTYSKEEETRAGKMEQQIADALKRKRRDRAMAEQAVVANRLAESMVGKTIRVLVEKAVSAKELSKVETSSWEHGLVRNGSNALPKLSGTVFISRGEADAPDIDGRVYVTGTVVPGEFANVKIVGHSTYDLMAVPA